MELYFSPLACSMATRIALYEAGGAATYTEIDPKTKRVVATGADYREIYALGLVPALRADDGELIVENAAVLQYVAARHPSLGPATAAGATRLQQWLCFIGTELHKALFVPLLDKSAPPEVKQYALAKGKSRLAYLDRQLAGREALLDAFGVADAYLATILTWTLVTPVSLAEYPAIQAYFARIRERPSYAKAFAEERELFALEQARHASA